MLDSYQHLHSLLQGSNKSKSHLIPITRDLCPSSSGFASMSFVEAHYHPFLFTTLTLCAMAELGLTAFLINTGTDKQTWPTSRYHHLIILFCFNGAWTTLFGSTYLLWLIDGAGHFLANVASSLAWLLVTSILWASAAGLMHNTRTGGSCPGSPIISRCRQSLTVEILGWTAFGLCILAIIATCSWLVASRQAASKANISEADSASRLV